MELAYFALGMVAGGAFAILVTKHRWWTPEALALFHHMQDAERRRELRSSRETK